MKKLLARYSKTLMPNEACGLILLDGTFVGMKNIADDPIGYFKICPREYKKYLGKIKAIFHSHPYGEEISDFDIAGCNNTYLPWVILRLPETFEIIYPVNYRYARITI